MSSLIAEWLFLWAVFYPRTLVGTNRLSQHEKKPETRLNLWFFNEKRIYLRFAVQAQVMLALIGSTLASSVIITGTVTSPFSSD